MRLLYGFFLIGSSDAPGSTNSEVSRLFGKSFQSISNTLSLIFRTMSTLLRIATLDVFFYEHAAPVITLTPISLYTDVVTTEPRYSDIGLTSEIIDNATQKSAAVIRKFQKHSGAYPASSRFAAYSYCWMRDGAFTADGMSSAGQIESAERFFDWCAKVITDRRQYILEGGKLDARYSYDGQESTEEWATFQLDGYGLLLWALKRHAERHHRDIEKYQEMAGLVQHYLVTHWREQCFDWWEERKGTHAASLASIYAGLAAYRHPEASAVKTAIDLRNEQTDASLLVCTLFDAVSLDAFLPTLQRIESSLVSTQGGVHRYEADIYYGGGEWPVLAGFLGWHYQKTGRTSDAERELRWIIGHMQPNGWIAEQSQDSLLHPEHYQPWVEKWGEPANPLLWSQAMLLILASEMKQPHLPKT